MVIMWQDGGNVMVIFILQYINISNIVHLKCTQCYMAIMSQ